MGIVNQHVRDDSIGGRDVRRTIKNWANFRKRGGLWQECDPAIDVADDPPEDWGGAYEFQRGSRLAALQVHFGDRTDSGSAMYGVRLAERPECWMNVKALGGLSDPVYGQREATWPGFWQDADLRFEAGRRVVRKEIVISGRTGPRRFRFALRLAPGHTFTVADNALRVFDADGVQWLHSPAAYGFDANNVPVAVTMEHGSTVTYRGRDYPTIWISLSAQDHAEAALPITIDPTATISGASAIEDAQISQNVANNNFGASGALGIGNPNFGGGSESARYGAFVRIASTASIPAATITGFRYKIYRGPNGSYSLNGNNLDAYIVKDINTWVEGTGNGSASQTGSCCWSYRKYSSEAWASGVVLGGMVQGTDVDTNASPPTVAYAAYTSGPDVLFTITLDATWPGLWKLGTRVNNGIAIRSRAGVVNDYFGGYSSDFSTPSYLEIDYEGGTAAAVHQYGIRRRG